MEGITVDRLFRCVKEVELAGRQFKVRALSDLEMQMRYRLALLAKVRALKPLRDETSDEYAVVRALVEDSTDEQLRATLFALPSKRREFIEEAERELPIPYIPFPNEASREEEVEILEKRQAAIQETDKARVEYVKKKMESYRTLLKDWDREKLVTETFKGIISSTAESAFQDEWVNQTLSMSLDGQLSLEDVRNLSIQAKAFLMQSFAEVNDLDPLPLAGRPATVSPTASPPSSAMQASLS
jgi:hypothetical protein